MSLKIKCHKKWCPTKQSCIRKTLNHWMCADSSLDTKTDRKGLLGCRKGLSYSTKEIFMTFVELPFSGCDDISVQELQCWMLVQDSRKNYWDFYDLSPRYFDSESAVAIHTSLQGHRSWFTWNILWEKLDQTKPSSVVCFLPGVYNALSKPFKDH